MHAQARIMCGPRASRIVDVDMAKPSGLLLALPLRQSLQPRHKMQCMGPSRQPHHRVERQKDQEKTKKKVLTSSSASTAKPSPRYSCTAGVLEGSTCRVTLPTRRSRCAVPIASCASSGVVL